MITVDIVFDVESDGQFPGRYSMVQLGAVAISNMEIVGDFMAYLKPVTEFWEPEALAACNLTREITLGYPPAEEGIKAFYYWCMSHQHHADRLQGWSDNPAFDWQFLNNYMHTYQKTNILGHSCRRIGDFSSGLLRKPRDHSSWKKLKDTKHTHVAVDDARGNGEALIKLFKQAA